MGELIKSHGDEPQKNPENGFLDYTKIINERYYNKELEAQHATAITLEGVNAWFPARRHGSGEVHVLEDISLTVPNQNITAFLGASGCGKSTLLRIINRMHEEFRGAGMSGTVRFGDVDIYDSSVDPIAVRRAFGMVFQKPNPFPGLSIADNVVAGLKLTGKLKKEDKGEMVETFLTRVGLWNEVRDKLKQSGAALSGGQQQRLCIARALAMKPAVLLLDEPTSSLDPGSTTRIEDLLKDLREEMPIVIVTHNIQQAARISDQVVFLHAEQQKPGKVVEIGQPREFFVRPHTQLAEDFIRGRFG